MNWKKRISIIGLLLLLLGYSVYSREYFPEASMGMSETDLRLVYPNLVFEINDAYISAGNAVITRCYIDPNLGLYRIEANMFDDDPVFMDSLVDVISRTYGTPLLLNNQALWESENGVTFDDPNTAAIEVSLRGGWITVAKIFKNVPQDAVAMKLYSIGETGQAGGIVFFDKGEYVGGWRYLEYAPKETEKQVMWAPATSSVDITAEELGSLPVGGGEGLESTRILTEILNRSGLKGYAVQLTEGFNYGGADDWYVPTIHECYELLRVFRNTPAAGISSNDYWSSSAVPDRHFKFMVRFVAWDGKGFGLGITRDTNNIKSVRFIRRF